MRPQELRDFDTSRLSTSANNWQLAATNLETQAEQQENEAARLEEVWPSSTGRQAATELRALARQERDRAAHIRRQAPLLTRCGDSISGAKRQLIDAEARLSVGTYEEDDAGHVRIIDPAKADRPECTQERRDIEHAIFLALSQAGRADEDAYFALMACEGLPPGRERRFADTGPVHLDDASIRDQALNSHQRGFGDCYFVTAAMAAGLNDPEFVRRHIRWDASAQEYVVTLYVGRTPSPAEFRVRPQDLDPRGTQGPNGEPTFVSIYEAAYRQIPLHRVESDTPLGDLPSAGQMLVTGSVPPVGPIGQKGDFSEIRKALEAGRTVTVGTGYFTSQDPEITDAHRLHGRHAYVVKGFDEQGRIVLVNPWGHNVDQAGRKAVYPMEVHLTATEFKKQTMQTAIGRTDLR